MLSLSIFSSSQRISVALYEGKLLKKFFEKIIKGKQNDSIFLLINKVLNKKIKLSKIFFSVGPGSFTALRALKAIAQAIAFSHKAKIFNVTEFEIYLSCLENSSNSVPISSSILLEFTSVMSIATPLEWGEPLSGGAIKFGSGKHSHNFFWT